MNAREPIAAQHARRREPAAERRHDDLHRDVGARARARRRQPRPGLPRFRLRSRSWSTPSMRRCAPASTSTRRWPAYRSLRERIADQDRALYGRRYDPATEITVTAGATQAILTAVLAFVGPGDEVIVLDPCYDSYAPNVDARRRPRRCTCRSRRRPSARTSTASPRRSAPKTQGDHRQLAAQPERHGLVGRRHAAPRRAAAADRRRRHQRRGLRAHGVRRRAPERGTLPRARRAHASSSRASARPITSPAGRSAMRPRRRRSAPSSARCTSSTSSPSTRRCSTASPRTWPTPRTTSSCRRSTAPSATASAPASRRRGCACCRAQGTYFQCVDYSAVERARRRRLLPLADDRDRRRRDSALGVLRRRLRAEASPASASRRRTRRSTSRSTACARSDERQRSGGLARGAGVGRRGTRRARSVALSSGQPETSRSTGERRSRRRSGSP